MRHQPVIIIAVTFLWNRCEERLDPFLGLFYVFPNYNTDLVQQAQCHLIPILWNSFAIVSGPGALPLSPFKIVHSSMSRNRPSAAVVLFRPYSALQSSVYFSTATKLFTLDFSHLSHACIDSAVCYCLWCRLPYSTPLLYFFVTSSSSAHTL